MSRISTVVALYVDPRGPYPELVEQWYDAERDARTYAGDLPVVAHPPCGPWGKLRHLCTRQDRELAPIAVAQVRRWGGVLEHPAFSRLFAACGMPAPGELPDEHGGVTIEVEQVRWGHCARKRTWLYLVGVRSVGEMPPPREPTHWVSADASRRKMPRASNERNRRTPIEFAHYLISLAQSVQRRAA